MVYKAEAKINLGLKIKNKREDWYHDIDSIFQRISLCDELTFKQKTNWIEIKTTWEFRRIPTNAQNTCFKAVYELKKRFWIQKWIHITIEKNVPLMAWLWWGSSDAACVLKYLNKAWDINLSVEELILIWKEIWADIPFFISDLNIANVSWIWENIKELGDWKFKGAYVALFKENFVEINTAWAYDKYDKYTSSNEVLSSLTNDFEPAIFEHYPDLKSIKESFIDKWALQANMTWSWSVIFGIFKEKKLAQEAIAELDMNWWGWVYTVL